MSVSIATRSFVSSIHSLDPIIPGQCCGSGSGIRCLFDLRTRIRDRFFSGSRIPNPYSWELSDKLLGKKFYYSLKTGPNFFLQHFKYKIIFSFVKLVATKKGMTTYFFHRSLLLLFLFWDLGSEIWDLGYGIRDLGSRMGKNQDPG